MSNFGGWFFKSISSIFLWCIIEDNDKSLPGVRGAKSYFHNTFFIMTLQKHLSRSVLRKTYSENVKQIYKRTPMPRCDFNKFQFYWNCTLTWVFSSKLTAYFQNTFLYEHLWRTASGLRILRTKHSKTNLLLLFWISTLWGINLNIYLK